MRRVLGLISLTALAISLAGCVTTEEPGAQSFGTPEEAKLVGLARDVEGRGETGTALALYERAAAVSQGSPEAYVRLGEARIKAGDTDGAIEAFQTALSSNPQNPRALLGIGTAQLNRGDVEGAVTHLASAAPAVNTSVAYNRLGTALVLSGKPADAKGPFAKAKELDPQNLDVAANAALAEALAGDGDAAIGHMQAVAMSPLAKPRHRRNLFIVMALAGRSEQAETIAAPDMTPKQKSDLIAKARAVAKISDPVARARAVGTMASA